MNSWRDRILAEFVTNLSNLTLVADPDGLLTDEELIAGIQKKGFDLVTYEEHIEFRYIYESKYRAAWASGEGKQLVVVVHSDLSQLKELPYDLVSSARCLSFGLNELFPDMFCPVLKELSVEDLAVAFKAQEGYLANPLGRNGTIEFLLRHVFLIAPELIRTPSDLLKMLLRIHYSGRKIPEVLDKRLVQLLSKNELFSGWPLSDIVTNRESFFAFLQERWPVFLEDFFEKKGEKCEFDSVSEMGFPGPSLLPFDHHDVRVYVDNLFLEGFLHPVICKGVKKPIEKWLVYGVAEAGAKQIGFLRVEGLHKSLSSSIPDSSARHGEWLRFAENLAKYDADVFGSFSTIVNNDSYISLKSSIAKAFSEWVENRYTGLVTLPPVDPVMLHHIPRFLYRSINESGSCGKVALLVVDGLSLSQWVAVRQELTAQRDDLTFKERSVFAWVPTITSVSRQAIFSGKPPSFFSDSILRTSKEPQLWKQFWSNHSIRGQEVQYTTGIRQNSLTDVAELVTHPQTRIAGLVVNTVDDIMHGMQLGATGMHNQVRQWAKQTFLSDLLDLLLDNEFEVFLTSDHGNVEAKGFGKIAEGSIADIRGERVRVYKDSVTRASFKGECSGSVEWPQTGLPDDFMCLLAPDGKAFVAEGSVIVGHGGASIEELVVPFVRIDKATNAR